MSKQRSCLLGIDVGTTSIKVAAFNINGDLLSLERCVTPTKNFKHGWAEHDADLFWTSVVKLIRSTINELTNTNIEAICVASMGEAGTLIDQDGNVLFPIIAWFDPRTIKQANWWEDEVGASHIYNITGMPVDPNLGVNKLLWIKQNYPQIFQQARYWLSVADLLVFNLCGVIATDLSLASRTMLFDQNTRSWSQQLIEAANLNRDIFPPTYVSGTKVGEISPFSAQSTGLRTGTPVVLGGHDHLCGAFIARQGTNIPVDSTGTAEVVVVPTDRFELGLDGINSYLTCYSDIVPDKYVYALPVGYAGALIEWFRYKISFDEGRIIDREDLPNYADLIKLITSPLDCSGIMCYPAFGRVIGPKWNTDANLGAFIGLTLDHNSGHILQAIIEGSVYSLRENIEAIDKITKGNLDRIRVEGGAVKNPIWMQLKADITGCTIESVWHEETVVLGAAVLAGIGIGYYKNHQVAAQSINLKTEIMNYVIGNMIQCIKKFI